MAPAQPRLRHRPRNASRAGMGERRLEPDSLPLEVHPGVADARGISQVDRCINVSDPFQSAEVRVAVECALIHALEDQNVLEKVRRTGTHDAEIDPRDLVSAIALQLEETVDVAVERVHLAG
ncbi:hypothetical protein ABE10_11385 [Bacillus toyonensis]|nr:hypothetical protein [Bacillus toyonensis]